MRATHVRWIVLLLTTLIAFLLYLDRICLGFAEIYVREDLGLTEKQMAVVLSSFFGAYALAQVPSGWLGDRYGARLMLTIYLAGWSVCTGLLGLASGVLGLIALRLGCGLFQAGAYPTAAGLIRVWMPGRRGLASSIVSLGGRFGGATAPLMTAYLMVALVPAGQPLTLQASDILPGQREKLLQAIVNPKGLVETPAPAEKTADEIERDSVRVEVVGRIGERLPVETMAYLRGVAVFGEGGWIDDAAQAELLAEVNALLARGDLFAGVPLERLPLPRQAGRLLGKGQLEAEEAVRLNRLVLESALPSVIRKVYGAGWRPVMAVYGVLGLVVALWFWFYFRDAPGQHPRVNEAEAQLIAAGSGPEPAGAPPGLPWRALLTNHSLWLASAVQFLTNVGWVFLITWFPTYLAKEHRVPVEERGWMTFLPLFVGIAGMFAGGWLTDWLARRLGVRLGRRLPLTLSRFVAGAAFLACLFFDAPWPATAAMCLVALATDLGTPSIWAYCLDVGRRNTGAVLGWGNMWGNLGATVSPMLLESIQSQAGYPFVFLTCGLSFMLAGLLALGIDASKPLSAEA